MATSTAPLFNNMASHGPSSPAFIKPDPDDFFGSHKFGKDDSQFNPHSGAHYGPWQGSHNVNPMEINMNGSHGLPQQYTSTSQSIPSNFVPNNSMLSDDDLLGSLNVDNEQQSGLQSGQENQYQMMNGFSNGFTQSMQPGSNQANQLNGFSSTPDGAPIQSPFQHGFDFGQWQANPHQPQRMSHQMSRSISGQGMQEHGQRGPMTPMTPGNNPMQIASHHTHNGSVGRQTHQRNTSGQWDNSLGSGYSQPFDSPMASPATGHVVPQISEVLKTGTSAPSPATRPNGKTATSAEMKKAKRRASHNEVERRRRNHINDRITELADLVPKHRLEDEAVRRSVASNAAMPLGLSGSGISPPGGAGLAGSHGRRAGSVSQGPLVDDKDKGPAKGEVLDGAVSWTRDLLWLVNNLLNREDEMRTTIQQLNGAAPRAYTDDELRMLSEAKNAIQFNVATIQRYTRRNGTELYVPGHTTHTGEPVSAPLLQQSMTPNSGFDLDGAHANSNNAGNQYFNYNGGFKEEDELPDLEMN